MSTAKKSQGQVATRSGDAMKAVVAGLDNASVQKMFDRQICEALWLPSDLSRNESLARLATAVAAVRSLKPEGTIEEMLAVQIVSTHSAAMDCFRRAAFPGQLTHVWELSLRQADRLMATCLRQIETLARLRGKGPTNINLGNFLNVQPGGQAVVSMQADLPPALAHQPVEAPDLKQPLVPLASDECIKHPPVAVLQDEKIKRPSGSVLSDEGMARHG
jgi:hypothetical protein